MPMTADHPHPDSTAAAAPRKLGFIGLGNMGVPMVRRLLAAGHEVYIWNRDPAKAAPLEEAGAKRCASPAEAAAQSTLVGLCLTNGKAVEAVVFGDDGLACAATPEHVFADFSTIAPEDAKRIAARLQAERGAAWLDAPVSGGVPGAEGGTLICFVGGDAAVLERARPLLAPMMRKVTHMGPSGAGQMTKVCNQMIVAVNVLMIAETFGLAERSGVDVKQLAGALAGGFADSTPLQIFGPRMAESRFEPRQSAIGLMAKDIGISQEIAAAMKASTPVSRFGHELYERIRADEPGLFERDVSELIRRYR